MIIYKNNIHSLDENVHVPTGKDYIILYIPAYEVASKS